MDDWTPPEPLRLGKSTKGGMGGGGMKNDSKSLRSMTPRQRERTAGLQKKLEPLKNIQIRLFGKWGCQAGLKGDEVRCGGQLYVDHVNTRNEENADGYWNLQPLCFNHNSFIKGSQRIDFRTPEMVKECQALDNPGI